jgi:hypothetical protein
MMTMVSGKAGTGKVGTGKERAAVTAVRTAKPRGAAQFAGVVQTRIVRAKPLKPTPVRKRSELPETLSSAEIKRLKETEKRYAASRRAARSNGRDALYE